MAAAYAALHSVLQILGQIKNHPRPPISIDEQQAESLAENVTFLQKFLEVYDKDVGYSTEADALEMRIADAAHAAEDVIESRIVDQILADGKEPSSVDFFQDLQRVIDHMELVKREAMDVGVRVKKGGELHQKQAHSSTSVGSSRSVFALPKRVMVGFEDIQIQLLDKLTNQTSSREIISIVGMGGMGKTTLAMNVYQHQLVVERFDFLAWVTISQDYKISMILVKLILEGVGENLSQVDDIDELGHILYQKLCGRRYLIILDDIWDFEVWDQLKLFFPDYNNGSRIMITTRLSNLASQICVSRNIHEMSFLDEDDSWKLFNKVVFGERDCPLELKGIGKQIVQGCKGLPLSISVVGGLLAKSEPTLEYWEHILGTLNSTVNSEDNEHCLQILYMSYNSLPLHLKPFFLYIGLLRGAENILIDLFSTWWVAEGLIVKPIPGKSLEEAGNEYLTELIDRNLIFISSKEKLDRMFGDCTVSVHDLLRDLCLRESQKHKFFCCIGERSFPQNFDTIRRIWIAVGTPEEEVLPILKSALLLRSFFWEDADEIPNSSISSCPLLRIALGFDMYDLEDISKHVNLRYIHLKVLYDFSIPSSISRLWNLQALVISRYGSADPVMAPHEFWMMPQLRYVCVDLLCLPEPPTDCVIIFENLHTLAFVCNFKCSEEVVKRIPNIIVLGISYTEVGYYYLNNLIRFQRLEQLIITVELIEIYLPMRFPHSLKILKLIGTRVYWDDLNTMIGHLPFLESLTLYRDASFGMIWETIEGQFCSLRFLEISECSDLELWITDQGTHFPCLERLSLTGFHKLNEIPSCIGDIPTLQLITVDECSDSVCDSAERIKEEQEELGNEDLQVEVRRNP